MPTPTKTIIVTLFVEGALALAVAAALVFGGLYDVAATAEHWRPTAWLLHTTMRHSVARRAGEIDAPPPFNDAMVIRGAAHFRLGCAPCHGAPGVSPSVIERSAEPPPPPYSVFAVWSPQELFWIVKNGVKMTAMPGWPTQERDDELWDMVAFLRDVPTMSPDRFNHLALDRPTAPDGDAPLVNLGADAPAHPPSSAAGCTPCHGADGRGRADAFPNIAGLSPDYIARALREFRSGGRPSGYMQRAASGLADIDIEELARYYARMSSGASVQIVDVSGTRSLGAQIANHGISNGRVPACTACHALEPRDRTPGIPALAGQTRDYLARQLALFARGARAGSADARIMGDIASHMTVAERAAAAEYFASLDRRDAARQ